MASLIESHLNGLQFPLQTLRKSLQQTLVALDGWAGLFLEFVQGRKVIFEVFLKGVIKN